MRVICWHESQDWLKNTFPIVEAANFTLAQNRSSQECEGDQEQVGIHHGLRLGSENEMKIVSDEYSSWTKT